MRDGWGKIWGIRWGFASFRLDLGWGKSRGKVGDLLRLGGDLPNFSPPGGGAFDHFGSTNYLMPHISPRWGGWGMTLTPA